MVTAIEKPAPPIPAPKTAPPPYERWKFTWDDFHAMWKMGIFGDRRVELIEGEVVRMSPIGPSHDVGANLADDVLRPIFGEGYRVRVQSSFDAGESVPQPDIAVVPGKARDYRDKHPATAVLIVEVAETSLEYDRTIKASLYARAGVPDYWILNLVNRWLEVLREPAEIESEPFGFGYRSHRIYLESEEVAPLARPEARVKVADLLP